MFYAGNEELVQKELEITRESQLGDGSYIVPWLWYNEYKEYELAYSESTPLCAEHSLLPPARL